MSASGPAAASDPTQAFAAVGAHGHTGPGAPPEGGPGGGPGTMAGGSGMTWSLPAADGATQAIPAQGGPAGPDPHEHLFRPEGGARPSPNATQVMAPVPPDFGRSEYQQGAYDQPGYDQPIDYQAAGGDGYGEPYEGGYADDYPAERGEGPRSGRGAKIGIGVAAGAVLVIVVSLITLGGHSSAPSAGPANTPETISTPSGTPSSASQASDTAAPTTSPSSSASSPSQHTPGQWQLGDSGPEVKWLQTRLHQLGLYNGAISGTFDQATQAAVVAFQNRTHPADASGVVGRSTRTALIAAGSKPTLTAQLAGLPGGDKHHKGGGDNPADVKRLQQALAAALNSNLRATGQFDMDTFSAVVQYQSATGLMPDGIVNGPVWAALQQGRITG